MPHLHEKIDFSVEVLVVHEGKVLLRKHDKYGRWLSVGGHIELDEDPNQAAVREVKEEVGLDIELFDARPFTVPDKPPGELIPPVGLYRHNLSDAHEHVALVYFARSSSGQVIPEKEDDEWRWCGKDDIDRLQPIAKDIVFYAKRALEEVV